MSSCELWSDEDDDILVDNAAKLESLTRDVSQKVISNNSDGAKTIHKDNGTLEISPVKKPQHATDDTSSSNTEHDHCSTGFTNGQVEYILEVKPKHLKRVYSLTPLGDADGPATKESRPEDNGSESCVRLTANQKGDSNVSTEKTKIYESGPSTNDHNESLGTSVDNHQLQGIDKCVTNQNSESKDSVAISCKSNIVSSSKNNGSTNSSESLAEKVSKQNTPNNRPRSRLSPLESFRPGYLWVSDLTRQNWCEQQLYYSFTVPSLVEEKAVMTEGTNLHLERELAVHDVVDVKVTSSEDIWAIKVLNMITSVQVFLNNGTLAREMPIFGAPFNEDVFIVGLIDELRFDPDTFLIELWELKTRKRKSLPSKSQKSQHRLQVMLYRKLFDDLVKGSVNKETVSKHLRLDLSREFGSDVKQQICSSYLDCKNLDELMEILFQRMQCITCVQGSGIEYVHQDSKETIGVEMCSYSDTELEGLYRDYLRFWRGDRESHGVDIEEAWKCQSCDFADICDWRKQKAEEYCNKNRLK